ncbi:MAG: GIY-YIG nuclease family protein [Nitrospiraceae bacterium]|nr:MAG: GIY-YIG nuclease family protein [Nitrospiraceae bacterium]
MWHVYIVTCNDDSYYVGLTNELNRHLAEHSHGFVSQHTSSRLPITFEYSETFKYRKDAESRERQLKGWSRAKKEALITGKVKSLKKISESHS